MKKNKGKRIAIIIGILLIVLAGAAGAAYGVFKHYYNLLSYQSSESEWESTEAIDEETYDTEAEISDETDNDDYSETQVEEADEEEIETIEQSLVDNLENMEDVSSLYNTEDLFHILIIGVDSRKDNFSGRSDAMILVSIDKESKKILMTSFLRDTYVSIPGHGSNRLNAAYAYGGTDLLTDTIQANYGIEVDRCVVVNFYLVMDIVDALGGLDIEVSSEEIRVMNNYIASHNTLLGNPAGTDLLSQSDAGVLHLNGSQTLAYARVRYVGTDFARTGRQRTVITLAAEKAKNLSITELADLMEQFLPRVRTDLTESDCASLLLVLLSLSDYEVDSMTIPADGTWSNARINGMAVLIVDFEENVSQWYEKLKSE